MSGECKSYRLNEPMGLVEFRSMPDDIKVIYINAIREKYNAPNVAIAQMLGTNKDILYRELKRLDLAHGKHGPKKWDSEGFFNWWKGIPTKEEPVEENQEIFEVEMTAEEAKEIPEIIGEAEPVREERSAEVQVNRAVPATGSMTFDGMAEDIVKTIGALLGGANVNLCVSWEVNDD